MERLILEYTEGDGCTYSCTNTLPIVYESKDKAISDLETALLTHQISIEERNKVLQHNEKKIEKYRTSVLQFNGKKGKEKELEKVTEEFRQALSENREIFNSISDEFKFGGQSLYYSHFFENEGDGKQAIYMPNIYTLDEFFSDVE